MSNVQNARIFEGHQALPDSARGAVYALGNFDGVHLGHRKVIEEARQHAARLNAPLGVATFEPPPRQYFVPGAEPFRLTTPAQRRRLLAEMGVAVTVELPFDQILAELTDREFAARILQRDLGARHVTVGFDFTFGKDRMGAPERLVELGAELGFGVGVASKLTDDSGQKISSSRIRAALRTGDLTSAAKLLGRPWEIETLVVHGEKRGRTIGYPTANLQLGKLLHPRFGVYAVTASVDGVTWLPGAGSFGRTPTTGDRDELFEVYLFDFDGDLYDQTIRVRLHAFMRPELKFPSLEVLTAQIAQDCLDAQAILRRQGVC